MGMTMFEAGRDYRIVTGVGEHEGYCVYTVIEFESPLLRVKGAGVETVFNTGSASFVSAEKIPTDDEKMAQAEDWDF